MRFLKVLLLLNLPILLCYGQEQNHGFKFILLIDGKVPIASISECSLTIRDSLNHTETINLTYKVGELVITQHDYEMLNKLRPNLKVDFSFRYIQLRPVVQKYTYQKEMESRCFKEEYLIMKIDNYKKTFKGKSAYYMEYSIPSYTIILSQNSFGKK